ncbi:hypothetical protein PhCBS80983_g04680 [Powellomyces hirtus]|uniref:RWD domain-containing protein n=1 Tax=Powellomyces hirtus TaxID=109895 RepID=A0A507DXF7_9FUNG|nr:hypothetical protein PhCBS80983_g04680 [Powellomyces hirtus]
MTDYAEEQANELEVLLSIFPDEFRVTDAGPPATFQIDVRPEEDIIRNEDGIAQPVTFALEITYTETYPDTVPVVTVVENVGLMEEDALLAELGRIAEESVGMAMGFTLAASAKEIAERLLTERAEREAEEAAKRVAAEEEAERLRHAGTRVTAVTFDQWKAGFLGEIAAILRSGRGGEDQLTPAQRSAAAVAGLLDPVKAKGGKLTGRQLFEKDRSLASSDMAHMEDGDVTVDADLFEGMEDLDIDEEDDEEGENSVLANIRKGGED